MSYERKEENIFVNILIFAVIVGILATIACTLKSRCKNRKAREMANELNISTLNKKAGEVSITGVNTINLVGYENATIFIKEKFPENENQHLGKLTCEEEPNNYNFIECHYTDSRTLAVSLVCVNGFYAEASDELCVIKSEPLLRNHRWANDDYQVRVVDLVTNLQTEYENIPEFLAINKEFGDANVGRRTVEFPKTYIADGRYMYTYRLGNGLLPTTPHLSTRKDN